MNEDLLRFKRDLKVLSGDFETCNLNLKCGAVGEESANRAWEWGEVCAEGDNIISESSSYLGWDSRVNIGKVAAEVTKFNLEKYLKECRPAKEVLTEIVERIEWADVIVGSNFLLFDSAVLRSSCREVGITPPHRFEEKVWDTVAVARGIKQNIKFDRKTESFFWYQMRMMSNKPPRGIKCGLAQLMKDYNLDYDENQHHQALWDVQNTFKVFRKQIYDIEI